VVPEVPQYFTANPPSERLAEVNAMVLGVNRPGVATEPDGTVCTASGQMETFSLYLRATFDKRPTEEQVKEIRRALLNMTPAGAVGSPWKIDLVSSMGRVTISPQTLNDYCGEGGIVYCELTKTASIWVTQKQSKWIWEASLSVGSQGPMMRSLKKEEKNLPCLAPGYTMSEEAAHIDEVTFHGP
jgi:hypothetical protein